MLLDKALDIVLADSSAQTGAGNLVEINVVLTRHAAHERGRAQAFAILSAITSRKADNLLRLLSLGLLLLLRLRLHSLWLCCLRLCCLWLCRSSLGRRGFSLRPCSADYGHHTVYLNGGAFLDFDFTQHARCGCGNFRIHFIR